jgi:ATP citrate (pro-S)-lyase
MRVKIIKEFVMECFPAKPLLNYALEVEKITTSKKPNLILNVDGVIAVSFVDLLRHSGSFTRYFSIFKKYACGLPIPLT